MTITAKSDSMKAALDAANPNALADLLRKAKIGSVLQQCVPKLLVKQAPAAAAADPYQLSTVQPIALPEDAKAATILRAYARAGGGTLGELAAQAFGATPADAQVSVAPNGDIVVLAASAYTSVDVYYMPLYYDTYELTLPVASGVLTLPAALTALGVLMLLEAEVTAVSSGTNTGKKNILVPAASAASGKACLSVDKTLVRFNDATDHASVARVKLAVAPVTNIQSLLPASSIVF